MTKKITELPAAAALDGTELLPLVQSATTKEALVSAILTYVMNKTHFAGNIGDGTAASFTVNHALNTRDVVVYVYRNATPYDRIIPDIAHTDVNNITVSGFGTAPGVNAYRVIVRA